MQVWIRDTNSVVFAKRQRFMELPLQQETNRVQATESCPDCGDRFLYTDIVTGDVICSKCGLILDSHQIDQGAEWRAFSMEESEKKARVGSPFTLTLHDKGLNTMIDWHDRDGLGKMLSPKKREEANRLRFGKI